MRHVFRLFLICPLLSCLPLQFFLVCKGGQQAVGPTRAQTLYASQPLWASILAYIFLDETVGTQGAVGGLVFLVALGLAATAQPPDPECGQDSCEV